MSTQTRKKKEREKRMLNRVEAGKRYHIKKGDEVRVLSGENRGKRGKVREIISGNDRAVLQSLDDGNGALKGYTQHKKRSNDLPNGARVEQDPTIHISNLMLVSAWEASTRREKSKPAEPVKEETAEEQAEAGETEDPTSAPEENPTEDGKEEAAEEQAETVEAEEKPEASAEETGGGGEEKEEK